MTLGWADGVPLGDNDAIDAAGHDRQALSERVLRLFLLHALRDGYSHADMHQGNLKVAPNGDIIAYDFGIMGHIDEYTRRVMPRFCSALSARLQTRRRGAFRGGLCAWQTAMSMNSHGP